ncbi:MAG: hypothetical protein ABJN26_28850 [Stappiaceae bacterium]
MATDEAANEVTAKQSSTDHAVSGIGGIIDTISGGGSVINVPELQGVILVASSSLSIDRKRNGKPIE